LNLVRAYVGLGANLRKPEEQVRAAVEELAMLGNTRLAAVSSLYRTAPVGYVDQPDFINAVACVETLLTPRELLDGLLAIERRYGRVREFANAPRTLDLDVLLYGEREVHEAGLTIPHPRMHERAFVIVPLAEIAPDALVPGRGRASELLQQVDSGAVAKLESSEP
jgi:2-amino-4-hydroxy-6-hydroxymethyldihydropteridine diphosphokinase